MPRPKRSGYGQKAGPKKMKKARANANSKRVLKNEKTHTNPPKLEEPSAQEEAQSDNDVPVPKIVNFSVPEQQPQGLDNQEDEDYDEDGDDDYDPLKKPEPLAEEESEAESDENEQPDYSNIATDVSQVRTRNQKLRDENVASNNGRFRGAGLVQDSSSINVDAIFENLHTTSSNDWVSLVRKDDIGPDTGRSSGKSWNSSSALKTGTPSKENGANNENSETQNGSIGSDEKITIFTTYTFAGKLVRERKTVDANSAEAKAYLNSTNGLTTTENESSGPKKSYVTVLRPVPGMADPQPLRIKLKRPSLIDKFLLGDKHTKLSTLEKSRLDWASFVDKKRLKDDLAAHNKGGYLEKQDFLGRVEANRDVQYQKARELDRQRQWQQQQQQKQGL